MRGMWLVRLIFLALLATNVALRLLAPAPAPAAYRAVQLALVAATLGCLATLAVAEWSQGRRERGAAESEAAPDYGTGAGLPAARPGPGRDTAAGPNQGHPCCPAVGAGSYESSRTKERS